VLKYCRSNRFAYAFMDYLRGSHLLPSVGVPMPIGRFKAAFDLLAMIVLLVFCQIKLYRVLIQLCAIQNKHSKISVAIVLMAWFMLYSL